MNFLSAFSLASSTTESGDGSAFVGFLIVVGFLWAICAACNRKKEYDVYMKGKVRER
ncbi:hypothetical protein [Thalassoglobus sp.]|uniref:hypothetical protein n=1 Tax=Thalassoglobus sp. TaxID=2795869 RepID=UPI003AA8397D